MMDDRINNSRFNIYIHIYENVSKYFKDKYCFVLVGSLLYNEPFYNLRDVKRNINKDLDIIVLHNENLELVDEGELNDVFKYLNNVIKQILSNIQKQYLFVDICNKTKKILDDKKEYKNNLLVKEITYYYNGEIHTSKILYESINYHIKIKELIYNQCIPNSCKNIFYKIKLGSDLLKIYKKCGIANNELENEFHKLLSMIPLNKRYLYL